MSIKRIWVFMLLVGLIFLSACSKNESISFEKELPRFLYETLQRNLGIPLEEITINHIEYVHIHVETSEKGIGKEVFSNQSFFVWISYTFLEEDQTMFGKISPLLSENRFEYIYLGFNRLEYDQIIDSLTKESISQNLEELDYKIRFYKKIEGNMKSLEIKELIEESKVYALTYGSPVFDKVDIQIISYGDILFSVNQETYHQSIGMYELTPVFKSIYDEGFEFRKVTSPDGVSFYTQNEDETLETDTGYLSLRLYLRTEQPKTVNFVNIGFSSQIHRHTAEIGFKNSYGHQVEIGTSMPYSLTPTLRVSFDSEQFLSSGPFVYNESRMTIPQEIKRNHDMRSILGMIDYMYQLTGQYPLGAESVLLPARTDKFMMPGIDLVKQGSYYEGFIDIRIWIEFWDSEAYPFNNDYSFELYISFD